MKTGRVLPSPSPFHAPRSTLHAPRSTLHAPRSTPMGESASGAGLKNVEGHGQDFNVIATQSQHYSRIYKVFSCLRL
jgi:hypothetical protein